MLYSALKASVLNILLAEEDGIYSDTVIYDAIVASLNAVLPWIPNNMISTLTTSGSDNVVALPTDIYRIDGLYYPTTRSFLPKLIIRPNEIHADYTASPNPSDGAIKWIEYPKGYLWLTAMPSAGTELLLFYQALWGRPDSEDLDYEFSLPDIAFAGLVYYAGSHCLASQSSSSSNIRQFNTKVDSGKPTDNVLENSSAFFKKLFYDEMSRLPKPEQAAYI